MAENFPNQLGSKPLLKLLRKGDIFVFPQGLIHFQLPVGEDQCGGIRGPEQSESQRCSDGKLVVWVEAAH